MVKTKKPKPLLSKSNFWGTKTPIAIAHRGGDAAGANKQNTLAAFKSAQQQGYKYFETDVVLVASGEVVVFHGSRNWLHAGFDGDYPRRAIQKMSLTEIKRQIKRGGEKVSTLEEVLTTFPDIKFFIDPKTDEVVFPLAKLVKKLGLQARVTIGTFHYERLQTLHNLFRTDKVSTNLIIGRGIRLRNKNLDMLKSSRLRGVEAIQLHHSLVSEQMVRLAHKQGLRVVIWTANSPLSIKNAINCGADGIISDKITLLKEILKDK
jgi:glycerophosphoryl diester phosphodiesterase